MELKLPLYLEKGKSPNSGIVKDADGKEVNGHLDSVKELIIRAVNAEEAHRETLAYLCESLEAMNYDESIKRAIAASEKALGMKEGE